MNDDVTALTTLQFSWGGLFDSSPADGYAVHLVRSTKQGTPGPTLCGIDRFAKDGPGWSLGGGISGPNITHKPCLGCVSVATGLFGGLPITGSIGAAEMRAAIAACGRLGRQINNPSGPPTWWDGTYEQYVQDAVPGSRQVCGCYLRTGDCEPVLCEAHLIAVNSKEVPRCPST